ncbi:hypothetical protein SAMN05661044_05651 [Olivibacter domesticus]|uniref:Uncharacterized protein n=1 Tax=Olivibacter domesticus TaxID=407022 RepID=A0A1H7ZX81_OLID1|nr:hypothetical protein SAMN05661044_05651 [Olivibacter domesticus]
MALDYGFYKETKQLLRWYEKSYNNERICIYNEFDTIMNWRVKRGK